MIASIPSATLLGVDGHPVDVEVHVSAGVPGFALVGLPDTSCREARDRVRAALMSSDIAWPLRRMTVNLAPSGLRKVGSALDLAIAIALLVATEVLQPEHVKGLSFLGELGLDGTIRRVPGIVPLVDAVATAGVVVPADAAREAELVGRHQVRPARTVRGLIECLMGVEPWPDAPPIPDRSVVGPGAPDLADVRGQQVGRWALEVAAAGGHHLLLVGPPGSGKTMLAARLPALLPKLASDEALEATKIHSAAGLPLPRGGLIETPPFRAPHHDASLVSLVGGGTSFMRPGEISLAHRGVLFIDEVAEMSAHALDALRQPLEEGVVRVARARAAVTFPAKVLFVAAMNPCPCGEAAVPGACRCPDSVRTRYARKLSGPLLDRFDLRLTVRRPEVGDLLGGPAGESSATVAERVLAARQRAAERGVRQNADLSSTVIERLAAATPAANRVLEHKLRIGSLSARGLHRVQRVARTVADLDEADRVDERHVCAALELRADLTSLRLGS